MKCINFHKVFSLLSVVSVSLLCACSNDTLENEPNVINVTPTNLVYSIQIIGSKNNQPNGDGSGKIQCMVSAKNAVRFGFKFDDQSEIINTSGNLTHTFTKSGVHNYTVRITAYSSTDDLISISEIVPVRVGEVDEFAQKPGLIWSDEFETEGAVATDKWFSEIVPPNNGSWFNAEQQHYTNRIDNAFVSNGTLKIVAKRETYTAFNSTKNYTSARLNSKFAFTYGRIEVRAKLPGGSGTWPAIWTLGTNLNTIGWPSCGEIDIMEHVGNKIGDVSSAIHTPSSNGNTINLGRTDVPNATTTFHVYTAEWSVDKIDFYVDSKLFYTYNPATKNDATWPFTKDQFILLNIAMGGTLGGTIGNDFNEDIMEIDYVRVYSLDQ